MHGVIQKNSIIALTTGILLAASATAHADPKGSGASRAPGGTDGADITAEVSHVQITGRGGKAKNTVKLNPKDPDWEAPACWYEPKTTPKELKEKIESAKPDKKKESGSILGGLEESNQKAVDGLRNQVVNIYENYYQTDKYDDYNIDKQGKGMFWEGVRNPNKADAPKADACSEHAIWVPKGKPPKSMPLAVSPKILAQYAYEELPIPGTELSVNPENKQTVNLDTWVWLNKGRFKPVDVTASLDLLDGTHLSATTTAKPTSLTLEPGTDDAKTYPGSGKCVVKNGQLGEEYSVGKKNQTPPCGVRYLRASGQNGSYPLKATLTWKIAWKGSDGTGGDLPAGPFSTTKNMTVKEIQSIVHD
ncbi:hypothetical protein ACFYMO_07785 [Streptomyces sp. NPDC007025]|uniref:hypothetical protein n=1 Tax=Streptomyces sp. NPDC007025 TaxID=3364771 RepID=UPI00367D3640